MSTSTKKIDNDAFIAEIKRYPEIYDTSHPSFKQQDDKSGAWEKIARTFGSDGKISIYISIPVIPILLIFLLFSKHLQEKIPYLTRTIYKRITKKLH